MHTDQFTLKKGWLYIETFWLKCGLHNNNNNQAVISYIHIYI